MAKTQPAQIKFVWAIFWEVYIPTKPAQNTTCPKSVLVRIANVHIKTKNADLGQSSPSKVFSGFAVLV